MFGPESTGKTTLSIQLAAHYQTNGCPSLLVITYKKSGIKVKVFAMSNMMPIAFGQTKLENEKLSSANHYLL
jgi:nicotinamide riboside kinase